MSAASPLQVYFLTEGDGPPAAVVALAAADGVELHGAGVQAFLRELEEDTLALPDALLVAGGSSLLATLRRHPLTAVLPIFVWGPPAAAPPASDGVLLHLDTAARARIERWRQALDGSFACPQEPGEQRREACFRRWLWSRGSGAVTDAQVFGITAARTSLRQWEEEGWVQSPAVRGGIWMVRAPEPVAEVKPAPNPGLTPPAPEPMPVASRRRGPSWLLAGALLAVAAGLWWWWPWDMIEATPQEAIAKTQQKVESRAAEPAQPQEASFRNQKPPTDTLPELLLQGRLRWQLTPLYAARAGVIEEWSMAPGLNVSEGEVLAWLRPQQEEQLIAKLDLQIEQAEQGLRDALTEARQSFEQEGRDLRAAAQEQEARLHRLQAQRPAKLAAYQRAKDLADQGVLAYREIRSEWDALQEVDQDIAEATAAEARAQEQWQAYQELTWQEDDIAMGLRAQRQSLESQRQAALEGPTRESLLVPATGWILPQVEAGSEVLPGQLLAQVQVEEHARVEVVLPTTSWKPDYLQGSARLRPVGEEGPWMPTRIEEATSRPDGTTLLQLRLPVGWLALDPEQHGQGNWALECRLTAPVGSLPEESQPLAEEDVESS
jgi:hypothetical protein